MRRFEDVAVPIEAPLTNPRPTRKKRKASVRAKKPTWLCCPICLVGWSSSIRQEGGRCNDHSQDQISNCVGRLIPSDEFKRAEWRDHRDPETGLPVREYGPKRMGVFFAAVTIADNRRAVAM